MTVYSLMLSYPVMNGVSRLLCAFNRNSWLTDASKVSSKMMQQQKTNCEDDSSPLLYPCTNKPCREPRIFRVGVLPIQPCCVGHQGCGGTCSTYSAAIEVQVLLLSSIARAMVKPSSCTYKCSITNTPYHISARTPPNNPTRILVTWPKCFMWQRLLA